MYLGLHHNDHVSFYRITGYNANIKEQPIQGAAKNDPCTKTSISSKWRNSFARNFQQLLRRKFATDETSSLQYYESLRKWHDFRFLMLYFQVNTS